MMMMLRLKCFGDFLRFDWAICIELFFPPIPLFGLLFQFWQLFCQVFTYTSFSWRPHTVSFFYPLQNETENVAIFPAHWRGFRSISKVFLVRTMMRGVLSRREIAEKQRWCFFFTYQWQKSWHTFLKQKLQWQRNKSKWHKPVAKISPFSFVRAIFVLGSQRVCHASRKGISTRQDLDNWTLLDAEL